MTAWVGLTGAIGSGKSQVAAYFSGFQVPIIDADKINKKLIETPNHAALKAVLQHFGQEALNNSGCLNKEYIRRIIFHDSAAKAKLENILHPHIFAEIQRQQSQYNTIYGIIELPTLHAKSSFFQLIERVLVVVADEETRILRVQQRSQLSVAQIQAINNNQLSDEERLAFADDVLHNQGDLTALQNAVAQQHQRYLHLFQAA